MGGGGASAITSADFPRGTLGAGGVASTSTTGAFFSFAHFFAASSFLGCGQSGARCPVCPQFQHFRFSAPPPSGERSRAVILP